MFHVVFRLEAIRYGSGSYLEDFVFTWESNYPDHGLRPKIIANYSGHPNSDLLIEFDKVMAYYDELLANGKHLEGKIHLHFTLYVQVVRNKPVTVFAIIDNLNKSES